MTGDVQRWGLIGCVAAVVIAVVGPWLAMWPPLILVVFPLLGVEVWALIRLTRASAATRKGAGDGDT